MACITVPPMDISEVESYLQGQLHEDKDGDRGEFIRVLDLDLSHIDDRATLEGIRITCVEEVGDKLIISYAVDYHVHHGCRDIDGSGAWESLVTGVKASDGWEFSEYEPLPMRTTLDEF